MYNVNVMLLRLLFLIPRNLGGGNGITAIAGIIYNKCPYMKAVGGEVVINTYPEVIALHVDRYNGIHAVAFIGLYARHLPGRKIIFIYRWRTIHIVKYVNIVFDVAIPVFHVKLYIKLLGGSIYR